MDDQHLSNRSESDGLSPWSGADERELRARAAAREERTRPAWLAWLDSRDPQAAPTGD